MNKKEKLIKMIQDNPDLPVVPMVDGEIPGDDSGYWLGSWGTAEVDEYFVSKRAERVFLKSDDDVFYVLEHQLPGEEFEKLPETEDECRPFYDALPWEKAIIVYINAI